MKTGCEGESSGCEGTWIYPGHILCLGIVQEGVMVSIMNSSKRD